MPVTEQTPITAHVANGSTAVFPFEFLVLQASDLVVAVNSVELVSSIDYTVSGVGAAAGGSVTLAVMPPAGQSVVVFRRSRLSRDRDYQTNGDLLADALDEDADRPILILQELMAGLFGDLPAPNDASTLRGQLASTLSDVYGAGMVGYSESRNYPLGSVGRAIQTVGSASSIGKSPFDFMTDAQIASVQARDLIEDVTTAMQAWLDYCVSDTQYGAVPALLPPGRYKISASLVIKKQFLVLVGSGKYSSEIYLSGAHSGFTTSTMAYLRPYISNLGIFGGASANYGIFFGNITEQVYLGSLKHLLIYSGNSCIYAKGNGSNSNYFSMHMQDVACYSHNGHSFHIRSGPGNTFQGLYALRAGPGKAGYRMAGAVHLDSCNGVNEGDFWGVFGNDPTDTPGFGDDFGGNDFVDLTLTNCNIEEWSSLTNTGSGIVFHNGVRSFTMNGGKFDRSRPGLTALIPQCHSIVRARLGPNNPGNPIDLRPSSVFLGSTTFTATALFSDTGGMFVDGIGAFLAVGITTFRQGALDYPLPYKKLTNDRFQNYSFFESSSEARHFTANVIRFRESTVATTGSNLNVDVTGFTRVKMTAGSATSVNRFSFLVTPGLLAEDYLRNGELIVEATTANVTLNHNQAGTGKLILSGNASRTLAAGDIVRFMWRESDSAWVESGGAGSTILNSITNADLGFYVDETPATITSVSFPAGSHYAQRMGGFVHGFGAFDFRAAGAAGSTASWSVNAPIATGWDPGWSDVCVGQWSAQDGSITGHIVKQAGTGKILFTCTTTAAVIAAVKTCRFQYTYRIF